MPHNMKKQDTLQIIPLGGVGEIGKNMFVVKYGEEILVLDAGLAFPEDEMLGIDIVIPDISYLVENKEWVKGIILTHGHEDHIGAMPYVLSDLPDVPVWGTKLTLGMLKAKFTEFPQFDDLELHEIHPRDRLEITPSLKLEFFRTNHSIPDSVGVIIKTPSGIVVYTSDFKFDQTPVSGLVTDYNQLAKLGRQGVLVMLSDSTNADLPGYTPSEKEVGETLDDIFRVAESRIVIATFASNIHRIQQVVDAAVRYDRKMAITGRSIINSTRIAMELGYLHVPEGFLVELEDLEKMPREKTAVLMTGSQGEPMSALSRISNCEHRDMGIHRGDTVIISASPIPGNEKMVFRTVDNLFKLGAEVFYHQFSGVHVSGHGSEEEIKMMINMVRPRYLIPVHGEYRHMMHHAKIAVKMGMPEENVFLTENGTVMEIVGKKARMLDKVAAGNILVDGLGVGDVGNAVLRDRRILSEDGIVVVTAAVENDRLVAGPEIATRGFVYVRESENLLETARNSVLEYFQVIDDRKKRKDWLVLKGEIRERMSRLFREKTGRRPMIIPVIMEVDRE